MLEVQHPDCDVKAVQQSGRKVFSASSKSDFGRFLIVLMGLEKWTGKVPEYNNPSLYKQTGSTYGEQLEVLSLTMKDKVYNDADWFVNTDYMLDILDYWHSSERIEQWIHDCGYTPVPELVKDFCRLVAETNQTYYNKIQMCFDAVDKILHGTNSVIDLDFLQVVICHSKLLHMSKQNHQTVKLFTEHPTRTQDFNRLFDL